MSNKDNVGNPMQKGKRRQKLYDNQNNVGNPKNTPQYQNFSGDEIE